MKRISNVILQMKEERRRQGLSQKQLAEMCGKAQPAIARIERGWSSPSIKSFESICRALGLELALTPKNKAGDRELENEGKAGDRMKRIRVL